MRVVPGRQRSSYQRKGALPLDVSSTGGVRDEGVRDEGVRDEGVRDEGVRDVPPSSA